jgi:NhaP-type Na+/H+ or K+/H+ antiporter
MIATIQTLVLLLAVVAAVAVVATRLKIPQSILLVLTGVVLALIPGIPTIELSRIRPAACLAAGHLFLRF